MPPSCEVWKEKKPFPPDFKGGIRFVVPGLKRIDVAGKKYGGLQLGMSEQYRVLLVLYNLLEKVDQTGDRIQDAQIAGRLEGARETITASEEKSGNVVLKLKQEEATWQRKEGELEIIFLSQLDLNKAAAELAEEARTPAWVRPPGDVSSASVRYVGGVILQLQMAAARLRDGTSSP